MTRTKGSKDKTDRVNSKNWFCNCQQCIISRKVERFEKKRITTVYL